MKKHFHILLLLAAIAQHAVAQHTPITSQYLFNGLLINPAYAGSREALTANITHRQQWVGIDGAPATQLLSIHSPVKGRKIGLGLMLYNDRIGVSRETGVMTNYAYRLKFPHGKLALGLGAGMHISRSDWQQLAVQQQNDITFQAMDRSAVKPNFSTGAYYSNDRYFIGLSIPFLLHHGTQPSEVGSTYTRTLNPQPMLFGGHLFTLNTDLKLKPTSLLRYTPGAGLQGDVSANLIIREKIWIGASYRHGDAVIGSIEVLPSPQWRIGYAYDMGLSALNAHHLGSHGVMLQYEFGYRIRVRDPRYF